MEAQPKRAFAVVYPLHSGVLGGAAHTVLTVLAGAMLGWYAISGAWLWWRRRTLKPREQGRTTPKPRRLSAKPSTRRR